MDLPPDIQSRLGPFGLSHKLGDAAAGKEGAEIDAAIEKVAKGLMNNDWSVRAPAGPRGVSKKALIEKIEGLGEEEANEAKALLAKLGVEL